jgi:hypothetical protein
MGARAWMGVIVAVAAVSSGPSGKPVGESGLGRPAFG